MRRLAYPVAAYVLFAGAGAQQNKRISKARKKGLTGYDFVDSVDPWFGRDTPPHDGAREFLDNLGDKDGEVTARDWEKIGLPLPHFNYFDKDNDGYLNSDEATSWFLQRKPARTMNLSEVDDPPRGHLERLGSWRPPLDSEHLVYHKPYPHPREFWHKHMDGYLPAVLKGAQAGWPAMNWTREVLTERFGWVDAKLEPKKEGRGNDTAYRDLDEISPNHRLNISEYLRLEEGQNMYVVSIIPQAMAWEVAHPAVFLCGSRKKFLDKGSKPPYRLTKHEYPHEAGHAWMTHLFEANLWMGSGKTRSQFHYDKEWNVNCLLSGRKRWFFLNPFWYDEELQWARGNKFVKKNPLNNRWTDWVYLDPDNVDLIVQNRLRNMDYYELIQEPGDCVFIPYAMLHQVEKLDADLQVAVSWMFLPETVYDEQACKHAPLEEDLPLAVLDTLYMYTGKGIIPQGYADPRDFARKVEDRMRMHRKSHLTLELLTECVSEGGAILRKAKNRKQKIRKIFDLLNSHAKDPSKGLTATELYSVPMRLWCKPAAEGDDEGPLPCDLGQEYFFCDDNEFQKMEKVVQAALAKHRAKDSTGSPAQPLPKASESRGHPGQQKFQKNQRAWKGREEL